ncbi:hypothetical protein [Pseudonocardia alaniniphila]|nr:hypothetical protein [Pseudonocardia alaniniphila]
MKKSYHSIAVPISAVIASLAVEGRAPGDWSPTSFMCGPIGEL